MNEKKKPEIRFPEFTDDWEQRKLGELSERVIVGLATSVTPYYRNEGTPILRNLNIKENYLDDSDILFLDDEYADGQTGKKIHTGDVLTVHTGYIGTSCIVPEKYDGCLTFTTLITTTNSTKLNGEFLSQYLNSEMGLSAVQMVTTQGGRQNLNTNDFVNVPIPHPSIDEQKKICDILRNFDNLITLHQRKCDKLKEYKRGCLQKMFLRDGADVPEVRFPEFTGAWEQRKLGDILEFQNGFNGGRKAFGEGVPLISVMDILNNQFITYDSIRGKATVTDAEYERYKVSYGDVLFQRSSENVEDAGSTNVYVDTDKNAIFGGFVIRGKKKYPYCPKFMKYLLDTKAVRNQITKKAQGAQHVNVSQETLQDVMISLPSEAEQFKIEKCLFEIDNLITLHQRECEMYKKYKSGLLQKMFV